MTMQAPYVAKVSQDNYGRWFVEVVEGRRKLAPIRCFSEGEARDLAERFAGTSKLRTSELRAA